MGHAQVNGIKLYYERSGAGPPILLIPGIPAVVSDCLPLVEGLSDAFTVIAYDNRGSGQSDAPSDTYSMELFAQDAAGLLDHLGVDRAHVVGFSMGGMIAQHLAILFPQRVERLVLACTHAGLAHSIPPSREVGKAFQRDVTTWRERIEALGPFAFAPSYPTEHPDEYRAFIRKKAAEEQPLQGYRSQIEAVIAHDSYDRLPDIRHRTLVITGSGDQVVPAENSKMLWSRIPNADLVLIEGAGHLFFAEKPRETMAALRAFLLETPIDRDGC